MAIVFAPNQVHWENLLTTLNFVEESVEIGKDYLKKFVLSLPMSSLFHSVYYDTIVTESMHFPSIVSRRDRDNADTAGIIGIVYKLDEVDDLPRQIIKETFLINVRTLLRNYGGRQEDLDRFGINLESAGVFFDYITSYVDPTTGERKEAPVLHQGDSCGFATGCISPRNQPLLSFEQDHALGRNQGGDIGLQQMCRLHNRQKQDNPIFDHLSMFRIMG